MAVPPGGGTLIPRLHRRSRRRGEPERRFSGRQAAADGHLPARRSGDAAQPRDRRRHRPGPYRPQRPLHHASSAEGALRDLLRSQRLRPRLHRYFRQRRPALPQHRHGRDPSAAGSRLRVGLRRRQAGRRQRPACARADVQRQRLRHRLHARRAGQPAPRGGGEQRRALPPAAGAADAPPAAARPRGRLRPRPADAAWQCGDFACSGSTCSCATLRLASSRWRPRTTAASESRNARGGSTVALLARVDDPDGDGLEFRWQVTGGTLSDPTAREPKWTLPARPGNHAATLVVSTAAAATRNRASTSRPGAAA